MKYKIITLGGAGAQMCKALLSAGVHTDRISHFGTIPADFIFLPIDDKFLVRNGMIGFESPDFEVMDDLFQEQIELFERETEADILYILVCGLGGRTGAGLCINLARLLVERGRYFLIIASMPFTMEGKKRAFQAQRAYDKLQAIAGKKFTPKKLDTVIDEGLTIAEVFQRADDCLVEAIIYPYNNR